MIFDLKIYNDDDQLLFEFANVSVVLGTGHGQSAVALSRGDIVAKINTWDDNPVEIGLKQMRIDGNLMNASGGNPGRGYWLLRAPKEKK